MAITDEQKKLADKILDESPDLEFDPKHAVRAKDDEIFRLKEYRLNIRLPADLRDEIVEAADQAGLPVQSYIKMAVKRYIEIERTAFANVIPAKKTKTGSEP